MCLKEGIDEGALVVDWVQSIHSVAIVPEGGPDVGYVEVGHSLDSGTHWPPDATTDEALLRAALARPSPFDPELDDEPPRLYTLQLDEAALLHYAGEGRRLIATWTTGGPKRYSIARNLALSIRRNCGPELERIFVIVALDNDAYERARVENFQVVLNQRSTDLKDDIWKMRWLILTTFLSLGLEVLVVDSDIVFFRDPWEHFHLDADLETMTDHFFPREQLWATWLRPAEHINTGFIFARPSPTLIAFLVEFIDQNYYEYFDRVLERDGMDQRVFNRYVMEKFETDPPGVLAMYEELLFCSLDWQSDPPRTTRFQPRTAWQLRGNGRASSSHGRQVKIRLLDPAQIAHGMNYFWRKAHRLDADGRVHGTSHRPPAVAHVNGVDPKLYFLRDRNAWYVDEWSDRFGDRPSFLMYHHPQGLRLKDDFGYLMAAIEVAAYLRRRVVLPDTMNCANSPAYEVWRMNETLRDEPGCTYDYFAHANGLYEVYSRVKPYSVEAGLKRTERFRSLLQSSTAELPSLAELSSTSALREEVLALQGKPPEVVVFDDVRVLQVPLETDIRELRDAFRQGDFGFRMNSQRIFNCAYQQTLPSAMACLDEPYVEEFGPAVLAQCEAVPRGCGPVGVCCCWPFWGYGEKLQYFTGVPWHLPCNCGLDLCEGYERPLPDNSSAEYCCRHAGDPSLYPSIDEGVFPCREPGHWSGVTATEDAHTYSTVALSDFLKGKRTAAQTFRTCRLDREMRRGEAYREVSLRWCNLQLSAFLLREGALDRAGVWWEWLLKERRGVGNASMLIAALDGNGTETDNTQLDVKKLRHDLEQLTYLVELNLEDQASTDVPRPWRDLLNREWLSESLLPKYRSLVATLDDYLAGRRTREEVMDAYGVIRPFYNRAVYVPDVRLPEAALALNLDGRSAELAQAAAELRRGLPVVLDDFLTPAALALAKELLTESTVWFASKAGGNILKAQLKDGLHAGLGVQIAEELRAAWPLLRAQPLLDILAYKFDWSPGSRGFPPHCEDGVVAMALWVADDDANLNPEGNGVRIYNVSVPPEFSHREAHGLEGQEAVRELLRALPHGHVSIPYKANRAVFWRARAVYESEWDPLDWSSSFAHRRVEWIFEFGRSQVRGDHRRKVGSYVPSFEGREDTRGEHYYAKDHDHR